MHVRCVRLVLGTALLACAGLGSASALTIGDNVYCFSSGAGPTLFTWCLDDFGLVTHFETPAGHNHATDTIEGEEDPMDGFYVYTSAATYELVNSGTGWDDPAVLAGCAAGALPCRIRVNSDDGVLRVVRTYSQDAGEKEMTVQYDITNLSALTLQAVWLRHHVNFGMLNTIENDEADRSARSIWGREIDRLGATATTWKVFAATTLYAGPGGAAVNDWAGSVYYFLGDVKPGKTVKVRVQYRQD